MSRLRMPEAEWAPIPEHGDVSRHVKTKLIFHSTGTKASAQANRRYFAGGAVKVESTFIVNYDGSILQILEADERADANGSANDEGISVEVVGTGDEPYTPAQVAACIAIARWACANHPIARRQIPSVNASGIGWHVMFGAPGPWTSVAGKVCPGRQRVAQVRDVIIPAARVSTPAAKPTPAPAKPPPALTVEDSMFIVTDTRDPGYQPQYLTNLIDKRWIKTGAELAEVTRILGPRLSRISGSAALLDAIPTVGRLPKKPAA